MRLSAIILLAARLASKKGAMHWLISLGGPGLILLGLADNSLIPLPGSTDVATIVLAARYQSLVAVVGVGLGLSALTSPDVFP